MVRAGPVCSPQLGELAGTERTEPRATSQAAPQRRKQQPAGVSRCLALSLIQHSSARVPGPADGASVVGAGPRSSTGAACVGCTPYRRATLSTTRRRASLCWQPTYPTPHKGTKCKYPPVHCTLARLVSYLHDAGAVTHDGRSPGGFVTLFTSTYSVLIVPARKSATEGLSEWSLAGLRACTRAY